jgi:putative glycosyltransferase
MATLTGPHSSPAAAATAPALSIVTTVYRSERFLGTFIDEAVQAISEVGIDDYEIIFVNDGSPDNSTELLLHARNANPRIKIIDLSRNFGHHKAMLAGLSYARGDLTFIIDCDLEVRPAALRRFLDTLRATGADVVYGVQEKRKGAAVERIGGAIFWKFFNLLSDTPDDTTLCECADLARRPECLSWRHDVLGGVPTDCHYCPKVGSRRCFDLFLPQTAVPAA